jgi:hypothetical protein
MIKVHYVVWVRLTAIGAWLGFGENDDIRPVLVFRFVVISVDLPKTILVRGVEACAVPSHPIAVFLSFNFGCSSHSSPSRQRRLESIVAQTFSPVPESTDPPASPQSGTVPCDDVALALAPIGPWPRDGSDPRLTAGSASDAQTPLRLARTGTDA